MTKKFSVGIVFVSFALILMLALSGVAFSKASERNTIVNNVQSVTESTASRDYVGSVPVGYQPTGTPINNRDGLKAAIKSGSGNYYLENNLDHFLWDEENYPNLSTYKFDGTIDGNGHTITFQGVNVADGDSDRAGVSVAYGYDRNVRNAGTGEPYVGNGSKNADWDCLGGLVAILNGTIKNVKFVIESDHYYKNNNGYHTVVMGGLVGFCTENGRIENVSVKFSNDKIFGCHYPESAESSYSAGVFAGGVTGINYGTIRNAELIMGANSTIKTRCKASYWTNWGTEYFKWAFTKIGGFASYQNRGGTMDKLKLKIEDATIEGGKFGFTTDCYQSGGDGEHDAQIGMICGANISGSIGDILLTGQLTNKANNFNTSSHWRAGSICPEGSNATGKYSYNASGTGDYNENGCANGITNIPVDDAELNFSITDNAKFKVFAPSGKIVWRAFGQDFANQVTDQAEADINGEKSVSTGIVARSASAVPGGAELGFYQGNTKVGETAVYDGNALQLKLKVGDRFINHNATINGSDLVNVTGNEISINIDRNNPVAIDNESRIVIYYLAIANYNAKTTIVPKTLTTSFAGASTNVLANKNVSYSGLCGNDKVTINGTQYGNGQAFPLTSAGSVTINAPSNNYKLENNAQEKTITVNAVDVLVEKGITIRDYNLTEASEPNMQKLTLNSYVASLDLEANYNAYGQKYDGFVVVGGGGLTAINYTNTLLKATLATTENLSSIKFGALQIQTFKVTGDIVKDVTFGEKVDYTADLEKDGQIFDGWSVDNVIVSYAMQFSIRVTKNTNIVATYKDVKAEDVYTHIFLDSNGNQYKTVKNATPSMLGHEGFALPNQLSWDFSRWQIVKEEGNTKTYGPIFVYNASVGMTVSITKDGQTEQVEYNRMFTLTEGTYTINGTSVTVGVEGLSLFATSDMVITKDGEQTKEVSAKVNKFEHQGMHYMASTYVASGGKQIENMALKFETPSGKLFYIMIDKYTKIGNSIYQSVYKFSDATLDQVFGTEEIKVTPVINKDKDNKGEEVGEPFVLREARV